MWSGMNRPEASLHRRPRSAWYCSVPKTQAQSTAASASAWGVEFCTPVNCEPGIPVLGVISSASTLETDTSIAAANTLTPTKFFIRSLSPFDSDRNSATGNNRTNASQTCIVVYLQRFRPFLEFDQAQEVYLPANLCSINEASPRLSADYPLLQRKTAWSKPMERQQQL